MVVLYVYLVGVVSSLILCTVKEIIDYRKSSFYDLYLYDVLTSILISLLSWFTLMVILEEISRKILLIKKR